MSTLKRVLSIGEEKKQPVADRDVRLARPFISSPHVLAPKPIIDEWAKSTRLARLEAEEHERSAAASQPPTQPPMADNHNDSKNRGGITQPNIRIVFADRAKPLPLVPATGAATANILSVPDNRKESTIPVSLARNSGASSWFCAGPNSPTDEAILQLQVEGKEVITEATAGGPVFVFRNERERQQAIRVLATLRESKYVDSDNLDITQCRRDCTQCLEKMAHRPNEVGTSEEAFVDYPDVDNSPIELPAPKVVIYVTESSEEAEADEGAAPRLSLNDIDSSIAEELEVQWNMWRASQEF